MVMGRLGPYKENSIIVGDCLDVMAQMPGGAMDLIFADPPFNVGKDYGDVPDKFDDYPGWCRAWIEESYRLLKPTGVLIVMTIGRHLAHLFGALGGRGVFINQIVWKHQANGVYRRTFWPLYQPLLIYGKTADYKFNRYAQRRPPTRRWGTMTTQAQGQMGDLWLDIPFVWAGHIAHRECIKEPGTHRKAHPTQMPEGLIRRCIMFFTDEGDMVADFFGGSGTTFVVADRLDRNFFGCDSNPDYVEMALERLERDRAARQYELPLSGLKQPGLNGLSEQKQGELWEGGQR